VKPLLNKETMTALNQQYYIR
jgi:hypothetical protein